MTPPIFANSAHVRAPERLMLQGGRWASCVLNVRYGLFISAGAGPVLIDTGYTEHALAGPGRSLGLRVYGRMLRPKLAAENQPGPFLARFGLRPEDISRVVVTHLHADHISGLALFRKARFLASAAAVDAFRAATPFGNLRHGVFAELLPPDFADRLDLIEATAAVQPPLLPLAVDGAPIGRDLLGDGSLVAVPLPGHADGHFGLVFPLLQRPLFYAVDAQWLMAALPAPRRPGFPSSVIAADRVALARSSALVDGFARAGGDVVLCHDPEPTPFDVMPIGSA
jgi:glyoxylase-like metal-dependent hydrolase (beta-lactamase superfamily II)